MKRIPVTLIALLSAIMLTAQITPVNYNVEHKDSSWYVTLDYEIEKLPSNDGMLLISHVCNPDTCISSSARHFQGKKFAKRHVKKYGYTPHLHSEGENSCTVIVPEHHACDTLWGVTYCEYHKGNDIIYSLDTMAIPMPCTPSLSCHRVADALTPADHIAKTHPYVRHIRHYTPLNDDSEASPASKQIVRYYTNSPLINLDYMKNAGSIDELMAVINGIMADSSTTVESVQIVGYTSPEKAERNSKQLGYQRALTLRDHIRKHHHLPDSVFEIADAGHNWQLIYKDIAMLGAPGGDSLINILQREPSSKRREIILRNYNNGAIFNELAHTAFAKQRGASINAIYYDTHPDSVATAINQVVNELINNPRPDYHALSQQLKAYRNDARALNLQGVIDYRRHRRHAAEKEFATAAAMGDEQAKTNLNIIMAEKER